MLVSHILCNAILYFLIWNHHYVFIIMSDCTLKLIHADLECCFVIDNYFVYLFFSSFFLHGLPQLEAITSRITESSGDVSDLDTQLELIKVSNIYVLFAA